MMCRTSEIIEKSCKCLHCVHAVIQFFLTQSYRRLHAKKLKLRVDKRRSYEIVQTNHCEGEYFLYQQLTIYYI